MSHYHRLQQTRQLKREAYGYAKDVLLGALVYCGLVALTLWWLP